MPSLVHTVVSTGPGSSDSNQLTREPTQAIEIVFSNSERRKVENVVGDSVLDLESSSRTQQWRHTLEPKAKMGYRPLRILVDSGSIGNYIDAREYIERNIQIENEKISKEL